jgi:hypothetical protein
MQSVNDRLRWLVDGKQRFVSIEAGWQRFLHYLDDRNGADIDSANRSEMLIHQEYIDDVMDDPDTHRDKSKMSGVEAFGRYSDVIAAFETFCEAELLPSS